MAAPEWESPSYPRPTLIEAAIIAQEVPKSADTVAIYRHFIYHFGWNSPTKKGTLKNGGID